MYKVLLSYRNWFRQPKEPHFSPFEELRDEKGNLILLTKEDCKRFEKDLELTEERVKFEFVATVQ